MLFDYICDLPQTRADRSANSFEHKLAFPRTAKPRDPPTRLSHLKARKHFPTHPLIRIARQLPRKLPIIAELEKLTSEQLAARFLKRCRKFK